MASLHVDIFRITAKLPPRGSSPQYRIRNDEERHERVTTQDDLEPASHSGVRRFACRKDVRPRLRDKSEATARSESRSRKGLRQRLKSHSAVRQGSPPTPMPRAARASPDERRASAGPSEERDEQSRSIPSHPRRPRPSCHWSSRDSGNSRSRQPDRDCAIGSRTLDIPQRPGAVTITDARGEALYSTTLDAEAMNDGREDP